MAKLNSRVGKTQAKPVRVPKVPKGTKTTVKYNKKTGQVKSIKNDLTSRALKANKAKSKAKLSEKALRLEEIKSNNAAKVAIAGEAGATITGSVGTGIGYKTVDQQVNGGMTQQGGLGRDEANSNNSGDKNGSSWEEIIGNLGKVRD